MIPSDIDGELRRQLLEIDTTFKLEKNHIKGFLPPNFYVDRLVDFIKSREAKLIRQVEIMARIDELSRHIEHDRGVAGSIHMSRIDVDDRLERLHAKTHS